MHLISSAKRPPFCPGGMISDGNIPVTDGFHSQMVILPICDNFVVVNLKFKLNMWAHTRGDDWMGYWWRRPVTVYQGCLNVSLLQVMKSYIHWFIHENMHFILKPMSNSTLWSTALNGIPFYQSHIMWHWFYSYSPSAAYMRQWIWSALLQIMACRLFGAKPLSETMLGNCQLDH